MALYLSLAAALFVFVMCVYPYLQRKGVAVNLREKKEAEAMTVVFTNDPESWHLVDQWRFQQLCRESGWSELRSADEARAFRESVEGPEA